MCSCRNASIGLASDVLQGNFAADTTVLGEREGTTARRSLDFAPNLRSDFPGLGELQFAAFRVIGSAFQWGLIGAGAAVAFNAYNKQSFFQRNVWMTGAGAAVGAALYVVGNLAASKAAGVATGGV